MGQTDNFTILIVDDEEELCQSLGEYLSAIGYNTISANSADEALAKLENSIVDLIIMDIRMPQKDGITLLRELRSSFAAFPIIMISAYISVDNIVQSMKYGALNFYQKPIDLKKLSDEIKQLAQAKKAKTTQSTYTPIISKSPRMAEILDIIEKAAPTEASVLITGESGTGKELIAHSIHYKSNRKDAPFLKLNCAAIPENLLESELFGYEKGAFTGADKQYKGKFEQADRGSIFLDEIGDMHPNTQAKILRVLQEQEIQRLGSNKIIHTDVRIIAATHQDLPSLIKEKRFREDLFYRLSVITIELPPLRERREDIIPLSEYYLKHFSLMYNKEIKKIDNEAKNILIAHDWPGNVRELKNCIERAVIFSSGDTITIEELPPQYHNIHTSYQLPNETNLNSVVDDLSKEIILQALKKAGGKKQKAAEILGIHRKTLYNKLKKLGLE
ncbi:sigma-54 dependent transcriptional regulator [Spirochaetia bacterium 38H-sp]|uniref:Sigma-54 dependent transcriptional regulator n=1 Tax=Rarispira pelagica TaxID=3141764 RepID=A0ABU9U933_9SPIR